MSFPTWTNALKIPADESVTWAHQPNRSNPDDPTKWLWRRDRRLTFRAVVDQYARYGADFVDYRDDHKITAPAVRVYSGAKNSHGTVTYLGDWIIDDINISHTQEGGKTVISVTLLNISDAEYTWKTRAQLEALT